MARPPGPPNYGDSGGGWGKWLIGAVAAAVVIGGGYFAYKNFVRPPPPTPPDEIAATEPIESPYAPDELAPDDIVTEPPPPPPVAKAPAAKRTPPPTQDEPIEATIGIAPVDLTTTTTTTGDGTPTETEEIVVPGSRAPIWTRRPSARRMSTIYPERELEQGRNGEAQLRCTVEADGSLDCSNVSATSPGFGRAAMRLSRMYRHGPERWDGAASAGSTLNLRVVFRMAEGRRGRRGG